MPLAARERRELVEALHKHPEWRRELRSELLDDEFLKLPMEVQELSKAQLRTERRLDGLAEAIQQLAETLEELTSESQG